MAELVITNKEYIYLKIPAKYIAVYHQLSELMIDMGEDMLKDCKADCNGTNIEIKKCFNMFNAALMARSLGKTKHEELLIKYIKAKLKQLKHNTCNNFIIKLDDKTTGFVDCTNDPPIILIDPDENSTKPDTPDTPDDPELESALCIAIKPTSFDNFSDYESYAIDQIVEENIVDIETIDLNHIADSYTFSLNEPKLIIAILIPIDYNLKVKLDDGFGGKVDFGSSGFWYSNGDVPIEFRGKYYKVYGELYLISSDVKYYIE